jgi:hypothetical protein
MTLQGKPPVVVPAPRSNQLKEQREMKLAELESLGWERLDR